MHHVTAEFVESAICIDVRILLQRIHLRRIFVQRFKQPFHQVFIIRRNRTTGILHRQVFSFAIKNLPPGDYTLEAWHERLGTRRSKLTVAAAAPPPKVEFRFTLEPAPDAAVPAKAVPSPVKKPARPAAGSGG